MEAEFYYLFPQMCWVLSCEWSTAAIWTTAVPRGGPRGTGKGCLSFLEKIKKRKVKQLQHNLPMNLWYRSNRHNLSSCEIKAWKTFRPERDSSPWPLRYRCSALYNCDDQSQIHIFLRTSDIWCFIYSFAQIAYVVERSFRAFILSFWHPLL